MKSKLVKLLIATVIYVLYSYQCCLLAQSDTNIYRGKTAKKALDDYLEAEMSDSWQNMYDLLLPEIQKTQVFAAFEDYCKSMRIEYPKPISTKIVTMKVGVYGKNYIFYGSVSLVDDRKEERVSQFIFVFVKQQWRLTFFSNSVAEDVTMRNYLSRFRD